MTRTACLLVLITACGADGTAPEDGASDDTQTGACSSTVPWASAPPLPLGPTQETAVVAVGDSIYVLGGFHQTLGIVPAVQIFDTITCTWSMGPDLPRPIHHANVAAVGGTIYVLGALETTSFTPTGDGWTWNPATETSWTATTSMPAGTQRGASIVGVIDDKIYVAGGFRQSGAVADVSMFDPVSTMWTTTLPALPQPRDHGCGGVIGGTLYVVGGRQATIGSTSPNVYAYTPGGAWTDRAPMLTARGGTACGVIGDAIVAVGGEGNPNDPSGVFPEVEVYTATTNTWQSLAPMPTPRHGMGAAAANGRLHVPGGATRQAFGAVATHEILTP